MKEIKIVGFLSRINAYEDGGLIVTKKHIGNPNEYEMDDRLDEKVPEEFFGKKVQIIIKVIK